MGLFSFNYSKPGPGVDVNEPEKKGFFRFWEIIFEKFSKLLGLNTLHGLVSIIYFALLFFIAPVNDDWLKTLVQDVSADADTLATATLTFSILLRTIFSLAVITFWGSGPSSAVYSYVSRCFVRRDPVWIISDGKDKFKENFKQSMIVVIIDVVALFLSMNAISFYSGMLTKTGNMFFMLLTSLMIIVFVLYTWMHYYIYQIMITFECTLKQLYKNALIFAIACLPMNLFLTILAGGVLISLYFFMNPLFALILDVVVLGMFTRFPIEFYASRKIKKVAIRDEDMPQKSTKMEYFPNLEEDDK